LLAQVILFIPFTAAVIFIVYSSVNALERVQFITDIPILWVIGFFAAFLGTIFAYLAYSNIFSLSAYERRYFFDTIRRSWQLVKYNFWKILGVRVIWYLVTAAVLLSVQGAFYLIIALWTALAGTISTGWMVGFAVLMLLSLVGMVLANLLVAPLDGIMQSMIYFNQRMKTEGFDIELRLVKLKEKQSAL
jgi:hypothetical protein